MTHASRLTDVTKRFGGVTAVDSLTLAVPEGKHVLRKHSGRHALGTRAQEMGFALTRQELDSLYVRFTTLADRKKGVLDEEIIALIHDGQKARKVAAD